jgi:hypothetical protein
MTLDDWIAALHAKVEPPGRSSVERSIAYLSPRLADLSPYWFTEAALDALFLKLRSLNSAERVRNALREYHAAQSSPAEPRPPAVSQSEREAGEWEARQAWLHRDWDDPAGIMRKERDCAGDVRLLRLLAKLVRKWAPQHLGYLPPAILEAIERDEAPALSRHEQVNSTMVTPRHLSPAQLDEINPLPGGLKRHAANDTAPPPDPTAA